MSETEQDLIERSRFINELSNLIDKNTHIRTLGIAYINAELATQTAQAILNLLLSKGVIRTHEAQSALADAYRTRRERLHEEGMEKPIERISVKGGL